MTAEAIVDPIKIRNLTLDGTWQEMAIPQGFLSVAIQARGANNLEIAQYDETGVMYTLKSGNVAVLSSGNFSAGNTLDTIMVRGTVADVCEMLGQIRV